MEKVTNREIISLINSIESNSNAINICVFGYHIWPVIRVLLFFSVVSKRYQCSVTSQRRPLVKRLIDLAVSSITRSSGSIADKNALFVTDNNYLIRDGNRQHDRVLDGIRDDVEKQLDVIDLNLSNCSNVSSKSCCHIYHNRSLLLCLKIVSVVAAYFLPVDFSGKLSRLFLLIREKCSLYEIPVSLNERKYTAKLIYIYLAAFYYQRLLIRYKVSSVYLANYYNIEGMAINLAAGKIGCSKYNVQHGVQSDYHVAFGRWQSVPLNGFEVLPETFLCWDDISVNTIEKWAHKTNFNKANKIGYPNTVNWLGDIGKLKETIQGLPYERSTNVLVTLQPSLGLLPDTVLKCIEDSRTKNILWWLRLHPRQQCKENRQKLHNRLAGYNNVIIDKASSIPLLSLLQIMDVHMTGFSSSIYEAYYMGIRTVLFDKNSLDYYMDYIDSGAVSYFSNVDDILRFIAENGSGDNK